MEDQREIVLPFGLDTILRIAIMGRRMRQRLKQSEGVVTAGRHHQSEDGMARDGADTDIGATSIRPVLRPSDVNRLDRALAGSCIDVDRPQGCH